MSSLQTDNSFFADKVILRLQNLPDRENIKVLDCYGGRGRIWDEIARQTVGVKKIDVVSIEEKKYNRMYLRGDNRKFLKMMDLSKFDIIDLDAYGVPFEQLEIIFEKSKKTNHFVFVTFIQVMMGALPKDFLNKLGYTDKMINKIPTLFNRNAFDKFCNYLYLKGIRDIIYRSGGRKYYIFFQIKTKGKNERWV